MPMQQMYNANQSQQMQSGYGQYNQMQPNQTQMFQQAQAGMTMPEPPNVDSTKDSLYLRDAMSWELSAMKKCWHFARECNDPDIQNALDRAGQMHQRHYQVLLNHINPANKSNV